MFSIKKQLGSALLLVALTLTFSGCGPKGPRALLQGKKLLEHGETLAAIEKLKLATTLLGSTNAQAFNYLGLAFHQAGQFAEAERAYRRALLLNPNLAESRYNLGCLFMGQNRLDQAKTEFIVYTLRRPNVPEGWLKLGTVQWRLRENGAAERSFGEALRLSPQDPEALTGLGLVRLKRDRPAEAVQFFERALKAQPDYRPALLNLAIVAQQYLNDRRLALEKYKAYLAIKPLTEDADSVRGLVRQLELEMKPPPPPLNQSPSSGPSEPPKPTRLNSTNLSYHGAAAIGLVSGLLLQTNPPRYAYKSPEHPSAGNRSAAERSCARGFKAQQARRLGEAIQAYQQAIQYDPSFYDAYYNLAWAASQTGSLEVALTAYETALVLKPESVDARYNFALLLQQSNFLLDAGDELKKILITHPNEGRAHLALGNLYSQQFAQPDKARPHYLRFLELDPHNPQAGRIRDWLTQNPG